jgi:hypothetical protein
MPVLLRENREGWRPLTVETEANGDSRSTYERGTSLVLFVRLIVPVPGIFGLYLG